VSTDVADAKLVAALLARVEILATAVQLNVEINARLREDVELLERNSALQTAELAELRNVVRGRS
jgi:hypothetical protein